MADQQSADALHLIARIKRIPQLVPYEVEARHSQRDREAGCGQRPSEGKAVVGRRAVHTQLWHIRASKRGVGTVVRPPDDERLRNRVSDATANRRGTAVLENSPITWRDERPLHFGSGHEGVRNSTAVLGRLLPDTQADERRPTPLNQRQTGFGQQPSLTVCPGPAAGTPGAPVPALLCGQWAPQSASGSSLVRPEKRQPCTSGRLSCLSSPK
jgi:hypothetical protein